MNTFIIIIVPVLLNIIGGSRTILLTNSTNEIAVTTPTFFFDEQGFYKLENQVMHLKDATDKLSMQISLNTISFAKELAVLKTFIMQKLLDNGHATDNRIPIEDCSKYNSNQAQLSIDLVQEFAKLKNEIVEEIRGTFVERHYNLSDHLSHVTHSAERTILSTVSSNIKGEIDNLKNKLQPEINSLSTNMKSEINELKTSLWTNMKNEINDLKHSLSINVTKKVNRIQTHSSSQAASIKSEIDNLKNSLSKNVENEINKIRPQLNELSTSVKNEFEDLKTTLSVNGSIKIDHLKSEIRDMKIAFQSQINSLSTSMASKMGDLGNSLSVSVKNEINLKIEQLRETIQPELDSITNASQSLRSAVEGKFDKLENTDLQMIASLANITDKSHNVPQQYISCVEALQNGGQSGIYKLHLPSSGLEPFDVYCMKDPNNGPAWTVVQRRQDGSTDFHRNWEEYKNGFGDLNKEFFIGLEHLHALTNQAKPQELWIILADFEGATKHAKYSVFEIGNEASKYNITILGTYSGDAGDSLSFHKGGKFSTHDSDNDDDPSRNCAEKYKGAWWFTYCMQCHLNGEYLRGKLPVNSYEKGINWLHWHGDYYSLKYAHMAIRPSN